MPKKAKITASGDNDASDLTNCYFVHTNTTGKYVLLDENEVPIVTNPMPLTTGTSFTFVKKTFTWTVPDPNNPSNPFVISGTGDTTTASGSWHNNDTSIDGDPTGESGTFQATANLDEGSEDEAASAATA